MDIDKIIVLKTLNYFKRLSVLDLIRLFNDMNFTTDEVNEIFNKIIECKGDHRHDK